ncbi:cell adhesion molecule Dscam2 [Ostrinia nubilalis]|uniref:cell adhesion molecule Dscam2 n=1 Tax=Ostrinia nubilalis TaxID=29057 RepID=UPI00308246D5
MAVRASPEPRRSLSITEPPHHVEFSNDTGVMLSCATRGDYQLDWLLMDGTPVTPVAGLRRVLANGSLELPPFPSDRYRRDVHSTTYRCRVGLAGGFAVLSKNIHLHAALNIPWEVHVPDEYVMAGNAAVLRCVVPAHCLDRVGETDWFTDDDVSVLRYLGTKYQQLDDGSLYISAVSPLDRYKYQQLDDGSLYISAVSPLDRYSTFRCRVRDRITGVLHSSQYFGKRCCFYIRYKYQQLDDGSLYISAVSPLDRYSAFRCRVRDRITGVLHSSQYFGHLIVTEPKGGVRPRVAVESRTRRVQAGHDIKLPCAAHAWPVPSYRWFRDHHEQLVAIEKTSLWERARLLGGGLLSIQAVRREDAGRLVCWLKNTAGGESVHFTVIVTEPISVRIKPEILRTKENSDINFECKVSGHPIEIIYWVHDASVVKSSERVKLSEDGLRLHIRNAQKDDQGIYQCFASNSRDQAYGLSEFVINESKPELVYWFSEQTLQPGPSVSLKCVAMGHPPPQFTWLLDGFPIPTNSRFVVGQHVTLQDDVVSHLNISRVTEQDGGEYACVASNTAGKALHAARVNVYGLPYIREMPKVTAVAGSDLNIKCPVAGYPIESISWERDGQTLPLNRRQKVFPNGTLIVEQTQRGEDAGTYTCQAANRQRHAARRDVEVQILVQPKILPIQPLTNFLREGMRAAISCQILEGDLPIAFRWEKNGQPVTSSPYAPSGIITRRMDEYSASLVIEHITSLHSGNYTCIASNVAGSERFTVPLTVNVPPRWRLEPNDVAVAAGQDVTLQCQADGYPKPSITWKKAVGNTPGEYKDFMFEGSSRVLENGSLVFERVAKDSEGHYLCEARNDIGAGLSKLIFLKVNAPARFPMKSKTVQVTVGQAAHLQCAASGDAPLEVSWRTAHHHTIAHHLDTRYTIREQVLDDGLVSELTILQTYRQDTGALTCRTSNTYGQDEMLIHLVVQEVPEMPKNIRIIDQQSRSIQISWTQPYAGNSPIINYIVQYKEAPESWPTTPQKVIVPGSVTSASVQNLQPATSYHLRIIAENRLGQSEPSQLIQVTTTEEVPSGPPLDVRVEAKSSTELIVSWEPPQRDLWNGNILGYYVGFQELNSNSTILSASGPGGASYTVRTVEGAGTARARTTLSGLQKHAAYAIVVQAYNSRGAGPASPPTTATTMEDVPSLPPGSLQCTAVSSQSVRVSWEPPPMRGRNGVLQGYRVTYAPVTDWYGNEDAVTKQISGLHTTLSGLRRYTNYSVTVCAFTAAGDGVRAAPVYCHTEEDVPSAPADIKAVVSSRNKILVSWLPPAAPNGVLVGYTLYMSVIEDGREEGTHKRMLSPSTLSHETSRSPPRATHQFWVSASTRLGEGETTRVVTVLPSDSVPARITSFSRSIVTPWKENISLSCNKVGVPTPSTIWSMNGATLESTLRKNVSNDGTLVISMTQYADSGNYTCSVENIHGRDEVTYSVEVKVPPQPPVLAVVDSYADSLHLQWSDQGDGGSPILGYVINYKREHGDWEELQVEAGTSEHVLPNLWCGTRYQLYITAFNRIGTGLPCDIVHAYTKGTVPVKPKHSQMITLNTTTVTVWLDSWGDGGCGILYFVIEYREISQSQWRLVSNSVQATERVFSVPGLTPAAHYQLRITAHNNAGHAVALYNFTTHSLSGNSQRVSRDRLTPAAHYQLRITAHNNAGHAVALYNFTTHSLSGNSQRVSRDRLTPAAHYQLRITAHNNAGHAVALYNFTTHSLSGNSQRVSRDRLTPAAHYQLRITAHNNAGHAVALYNFTTHSLSGNSQRVSRDRLTPAAHYQLRITAHNNAGHAVALYNFTTHSLSGNSQRVSRDRLTPAAHYQLRITAHNNAGHAVAFVTDSQRVSRDRLTPAAHYQLRITAHNNAGHAVALYNFTTHSLSGSECPTLVSQRPQRASRDRLTPAAHYQLRITAHNNAGHAVALYNFTTHSLSGNSQRVSRDRLTPAAHYQLRITAHNNAGHAVALYNFTTHSLSGNSQRVSRDRLTPAAHYQLRITAHNNAGHAVALYNFTTHSLSGMLDGELSPPVPAAGARSLSGARVILPAALSLLVLGALIAIVLLVRRNKSGGTETAAAESGVGESPSVAQLQNKVNRDQQYLAARAQHPPPPHHYKHATQLQNKVNRDQQYLAPPHHYKHASNEYIEDICPYATFQLTKPTAYSESSYSGNVYSGPYHSVRGSFVYHDLKQNDKYKGKEPEYTKVRRKGNRLRDPHSESQESDNLGSTDSEVKKILTLHLPITEYEDDASDDASAPHSDSEPAARLRPTHPPTSSDDASAPHSDSEPAARLRPTHPPTYPSVEREESSSSSENSVGGVVRKAFPSRKGKAGVGKRHVRSSSGYSSHNDETTFSISNYPSFNERIHPPSRFSDDTECDAPARRKRHHHHAEHKPREAFQINV